MPQKPPPSPSWMGTTEAAEYVGLKLRALYRRIDEGEIRAYKVGRVIRIRQEDLDAFLKAHEVQPGDLAHLYPEGRQTLPGRKKPRR